MKIYIVTACWVDASYESDKRLVKAFYEQSRAEEFKMNCDIQLKRLQQKYYSHEFTEEKSLYDPDISKISELEYYIEELEIS
jgi:hypothetical protein